MEPGAGGRQRPQTFRASQVYIIHNVAPRYWRWWRGVVGNAFRLKRSYSTPGLVSTAMGDYWTGTALGFHTSHDLCSNFLFDLCWEFSEMGHQMLLTEFHLDRPLLPWQQNLRQKWAIPQLVGLQQISPRSLHLTEVQVESLAIRWCQSKSTTVNPDFQV